MSEASEGNAKMQSHEDLAKKLQVIQRFHHCCYIFASFEFVCIFFNHNMKPRSSWTFFIVYEPSTEVFLTIAWLTSKGSFRV